MNVYVHSRVTLHLIYLLCLLFSTSAVVAQTAEETNSTLKNLGDILYEYRNQDVIPVTNELITIAQLGDSRSQYVLANAYLGLDDDIKNQEKALYWFKLSFDRGNGEIRALSAIANILSRNNDLQTSNLIWLEDAVASVPHTLNLDYVGVILEVFFYFPDLVKSDVSELIRLYEENCIEFCRPGLYKAKYASLSKSSALETANLYQAALSEDPRVLDDYYEALGTRKDTYFVYFAEAQLPDLKNVEDTVVFGITSILNRATNYDEEAIEKTRFDAIQAAWVDEAILRGDINAVESRVGLILNEPQQYSLEEFERLISILREQDPDLADYYQARSHISKKWFDIHQIDIVFARSVFERLIEKNLWHGYLGLADLLITGLEDEVDPKNALYYLELAIRNGAQDRDLRLAQAYIFERGLCHDPIKSYAHALISQQNDSGDSRLEIIFTKLDELLTPEHKQQGEEYMQQILRVRSEVNNAN